MNFALVFALTFGGIRPAATRAPDPWFGPDKVKHFMMSAFVTGASYSGLRAANVSHNNAVTGAIIVGSVFGIGKEIRDIRTPEGFSAKDLTWDAAGVAAMSVAVHQAR